jgi:DNA polymerase-3 subunit epsilon
MFIMKWFTNLFGRNPELTPEQESRLAAWRALPDIGPGAELESARFVVVDVETSGLILAKDRLIAIGAVAVRAGRIDVGDSFEVVLQQHTVSDRENILIHGIGASAQSGGMPPRDALLAFLEYLGKDPLIAFHVVFDETMIRRAMQQFLGFDFKHRWLDLAYAMPALNPELSKKYRALDDWQNYFHIQNYARHNALADAQSTAQLFLVALRQASRQRITRYKGLMDLEKAQRWVNWEG